MKARKLRPDVVLALSGGVDSTTLLADLLSVRSRVLPVSFTYGSKHNPWENRAAEKVAQYYGLSLLKINLSREMSVFSSDLLKSGGKIPEGHYTSPSMSRTVVPARNIIFTSLLSGIAWSVGAGAVALGIHAGDHEIYPDCRPDFFKAMGQAIRTGTDGRVRLLAPFLYWTKGTILGYGVRLQVPYHLTRTCYSNNRVACGKCGACVERLESFREIRMKDPIRYENE